MKKAVTLILSLAFVFGSFSMIVAPTLAKTENTAVDDSQNVWNTDRDSDLWDEIEDSVTYEGGEEIATLLGGGAAIFGVIVVIFALILGLSIYIYSAIALTKIAKRLNCDNAWFAWIPILNIVLILKIGDMNPLLVLLLLIPGLGGLALAVISIIALMKVCEKLGYDKLLALLVLIPIGNLVLLGMLAWGKKKGSQGQVTSNTPQKEVTQE
jgi:hypothetical protein